MIEAGKRFIQAALAVIFLAGFPLLLVDVAIGYLLDLQQENKVQDAFELLTKELSSRQPLSDPEYFLPEGLRQQISAALRARRPMVELVRRLRGLESRYPGLFSFLVFDRAENIAYSTEERPNRWVSRKLLHVLRLSYESRKQALNANQAVFQSYLNARARGA